MAGIVTVAMRLQDLFTGNIQPHPGMVQAWYGN